MNANVMQMQGTQVLLCPKNENESYLNNRLVIGIVQLVQK